MSVAEHYDAVIIGAGQSGGPLATALAEAGRKTALIERAHVGGTCINEGCTPTKTMVASARVAYLARRGADYGVQTGAVSVDMHKVRARKRAIVESFRGGSEERIKKTDGLDLIEGEATFGGPTSLVVRLNNGDTRILNADTIFINAGARPTVPPLAGLSDVQALNSTTIMELDSVPKHLLILGGGYIALEFGQMFRRFGSNVTIVQRGTRLLPREDEDVSDEVAKILREDGIEVLLSTSASRVEQRGDALQLAIRNRAEERALAGSHLLLAVGRAPNTEALNLAVAGVETDKHGFITVNERLETSAPNVYALGDIKGGPAFTHISYDDYRILQANLLHGGSRTTHDRPTPYAVFIDPQLGRVGLSEQEARDQGRNIQVAKMPMSSVARALENDEPRGLMKMIVDADTHQILGCAVLGIEGGEIMSIVQVAMMGKLPYTALRDAVFAHPTIAEALNNVFGQLSAA